MDDESRQSLFASPLMRIDHVTCHRARRGLSCEECKTEHQIAIPLSGVNVRHVDGKVLIVSPSLITYSNRGEEYRVSHPYGSGETALQIVLREDLLLDMVGAHDSRAHNRSQRPFPDRQCPAGPKLHFSAQLLAAAARSQARSDLELEETAIHLIDRILESRSPVGRHREPASRDLELSGQLRARLATCYEQPVALQDLAASFGITVCHLCRVFRRATGTTLWKEVQQLRVREALQRLAGGERDLMALALALGFSHHSHFTSSFRRQLGVTPSDARRIFRSGSLHQARQLLAV